MKWRMKKEEEIEKWKMKVSTSTGEVEAVQRTGLFRRLVLHSFPRVLRLDE